MKKITRFKLEKLRNEEYFTFLKRYWNEVRELGAETLKVVEEHEQLTAFLAELQKALEPVSEEFYTAAMEAADKKRDKIFVGLRAELKAALHNFDDAKVAAAKKIEPVFKKYGTVEDDTYTDETGKITNLIEELRNNYATEVTTLTLSQWLTELDKANKEFENASSERSTDIDKNHVERNVRALRPEGNRIYINYIDQIEALCRVYKTDVVFGEFIEKWNAVAEYFKNLVNGRTAHNKEEKE